MMMLQKEILTWPFSDVSNNDLLVAFSLLVAASLHFCVIIGNNTGFIFLINCTSKAVEAGWCVSS